MWNVNKDPFHILPLTVATGPTSGIAIDFFYMYLLFPEEFIKHIVAEIIKH